MKIPDSCGIYGRPRVVCPVCGQSAEVTARGSLADPKRPMGFGWIRCDEGRGQPAPDGSVLAWMQEQLARKRGHAVECRTRAEAAMRDAEKCDAEAVEIERVIARLENSK